MTVPVQTVNLNMPRTNMHFKFSSSRTILPDEELHPSVGHRWSKNKTDDSPVKGCEMKPQQFEFGAEELNVAECGKMLRNKVFSSRSRLLSPSGEAAAAAIKESSSHQKPRAETTQKLQKLIPGCTFFTVLSNVETRRCLFITHPHYAPFDLMLRNRK